MIRRGDKVLVIIIVLVIALGYGYTLYNNNKYKNSERIATIEIDGKLYGKYDLSKVKDQEIELNLANSGHSVVEFKSGNVRIKYADCPDKVCVRTGWATKPGDIIVCLPYRIVIKLSGERKDVDVTT